MALAVFLIFGGLFIYYYNVYAGVIDARLSAPIYNPTSLVFAAPRTITVGQHISPTVLVEWLREAGYSENHASPVGTFVQAGEVFSIRPGPEAWHANTPVQIHLQDGTVAGITNSADQSALSSYSLEPALLTTLFDEKREKRRIVHYADLPPTLVKAVADIEDRDFFTEGAVDWWRIPSAVYRDLRSGRREQGASTITMQVARNNFGLGFERHGWAGIRRKMAEAVVAMELEQRLTKQQIFELYANQIYLGQRGSYSINGFGEAAQAYFGKDVSQLTLPECALLAGIIHGPNPDSPYRHPDRAQRRRDEVLKAMVRAGDITDAQRASASKATLVLTQDNVESTDAPYFVDMVRDRVDEHVSERDLTSQSYRIYTTLDPDLQNAAARAVAIGMRQVDQELDDLHPRRKTAKSAKIAPRQQPQVALIALDPHTGAVLALVGGRNYVYSQLNHATVADRPTGSIFKPFVYATALETGLLPNITAITQTSTVMDEPTVFEGGYAPKNFENKYYGQVTLRTALEHSLNNATISLAEEVGLPAVTDLAHAAGIVSAQPTPSEAIGTYNASPLTMAEAYTVFANNGVRLTPRLLYSVQSADSTTVFQTQPDPDPVLDPRVAFLTTNLMESVIDQGTAVRVRSMGFEGPVAGKTGSSHDAWFAGYTSNLLCIVWVGNDDYSNIVLEGAHAALPVWTEFMMRAVKLPAYSDIQPFQAPSGVVAVSMDAIARQVSTSSTPQDQVETDYYLAGTQPRPPGPRILSPRGLIADAASLFHSSTPAPVTPPPTVTSALPAAGDPRPFAPAASAPVTTAPAQKPPQPKRGLFGKLLHALGGGGQPQ